MKLWDSLGRKGLSAGHGALTRQLRAAMVFLFVASGVALGQAPVPQSPEQAGGVIHGVVKSGNMPLPGVTVTASNTLTGKKVSTSTDVEGSYTLQLPANGRYVIRAELSAFAPLTQEALINASNRDAQVNLEMVLLSRAKQAAPTPEEQIANMMAGAGNRGAAASARGFQSLSLSQTGGGEEGSASGLDQIAPAGMPVPGMAENAATESVAVSGNTSNPMGNMSGEEFRQRITEAREQMGVEQGRGLGATGGGGGPGGFGFGGGGGGFGPGGGPGPVLMAMRGRGFDINRPHGMAYYEVGDAALDAAPYSLTGEPVNKPGYLQNRFGLSLGGPLNIPHIYKGGTKTFFFVNYNGSRGSNPFDQFSTVPTAGERAGDFSSALYPAGVNAGVPVELFYPNISQCGANAGQPIPGNNLQNMTAAPGCEISPIAQGLLNYIPLPNLPGTAQNFHYITTATDDSDSLNIRLNHSFGAAGQSGPRMGRGFFRGPRNNLSIGLHYQNSNSTLTNPFPTVGGNDSVRGIDVNGAYIRSFGRLTNIAHVNFNRERVRTQNLYAFTQDITGGLGINGVSTNPFDWGLPNLSFSDFSNLSDINPSLERNQTWTFSDFMIWRRGRHNMRFGGDFRRIEINTETSGNARGSFVFTGTNTGQVDGSGQPVAATGYDLADFLLGLPQQTSVQFGVNNYYFRGNSWDLFGQDNWQLRGNLTLNLGMRYEYVSPFTEINDHIANLILSPGVLDPAAGTPAVAPVLPGQGYPSSLMHPDRNNFAPRLGIAWKPFSNTVVRAGYGINYNTAAYQSIAQNLAFQPPFSTTETNVQSVVGPLTLQNGFPAPASGLITNSYAVDANYRLGYVQIRNLDIQQEIRPTLVLNLDYTGTKGTRLDNVLAPNSGLLGVRIADAQAFTYQTALASSSANAGSVRLRKRLSSGISIGGTYTFSKSIDNASSIGNGVAIAVRGGPEVGSTLVAQNALDLAAERGLSSFDQRHRFTADYLWELPFGHDKRWLSGGGPLRAIFGDWEWTGDWTIASGTPFTPRCQGCFTDVNSGTYGTIRADVVPGASVSLPNPTVVEWFNTAAFVEPPAGQFGDARRNSIEGPGTIAFDMAMTKVFPMGEMRELEFRAQASNVFNHPNWATIDTVVNSPTFGQVISVNSMRTIQMTARFRF
ncbi:MAG TPA: TonB-dependent receptor [Terriglobales bacterium]|nr:TonB-dependent receptor [Terriglobales bacterium]